MQRDDPTGHRPGGPAPGGPGGDTVLAALAHRLRARSERQQLLTERLRSGELRPGALADLAELAAAARRGVRDGDHVLVMAGADVADRGSGPTPLGQALSTAVAASEAASRTVVPPTPSLSLEPSAGPVFAQILAELLAHATAATAPGDRLEIHTRWGPDGGLVLELISPHPVPTRTPVEELDRMLAAGRPDGPVAPQEIGLYLAARLARTIGGRLGVRGSPGVASAPGPSPVAVLHLPSSAIAGARPAGEDAQSRPAADPLGAPAGAAGQALADADPVGEPPTGLRPAASTSSVPSESTEPERSVPPWPPVTLTDTGPAAHGSEADGVPASGLPPDPGASGEPDDTPGGPGIARLPVPPAPASASPASQDGPSFPFPPAAQNGPPPGRGAGLQIPPGSRGPGGRPTGAGTGPGPQPGPNRPGPTQPDAPHQPAANDQGPVPPGTGLPGPVPSGPTSPADVGPAAPPVELFGPFDSEVPVPVDDLDGTPIFAAVASAWFRDPAGSANGAAGGPGSGTNGHPPGEGPANWRTAGDAEFDAARSRADRVVEPPVNANGLPMRRPGQQMVPPARRDDPQPARRRQASSERQPDRVRNRLASYQRGLREGRHRAAEEHTGPPAGTDLNGASPHGRNGHAAG